jgi:hypothetical protein
MCNGTGGFAFIIPTLPQRKQTDFFDRVEHIRKIWRDRPKWPEMDSLNNNFATLIHHETCAQLCQ